MIFAGDKVEAIKDVGVIHAGMKFDVTGVNADGTVFVKNELGSGCFSLEEIGKIVKHIPQQKRRAWSDWEWLHDALGEYRFRHNGKKVQVELWNGFSGEASCHPDDEFDLEFGTKLAHFRAVRKMYHTEERECSRYLWDHGYGIPGTPF